MPLASRRRTVSVSVSVLVTLTLTLTLLLTLRGNALADDSSTKDGGLLVVTPRSLAESLDAYLEHKRNQLPVDVAILDEVLSRSEGADDPEKLKRHIFQRWKERGTRYVLLVGDADVLPVRYMVLDRKVKAAFDYAFYPSDLYYADLADQDGAFEDWNSQRDDFHAGYFGEVRGEANKSDPINYDDVDYLPDVAVGRWPVSTPEDARTVASKTIAFERGLDTREDARRSLLVCVRGWVDCRRRMDRWGDSLSALGPVDKRYYPDRRYSTPPPTADQVVRALNDGVGLVLHAGHGRDHEWDRSISLRDLPRLQNSERLGIIASASCSSARFATLPPYEGYVDVHGDSHRGTDHGEVFDAPPPPPAPYQRGRHNPRGFGEELLRSDSGGAVAYIGCNTGSQPCGLTLLEGLARAAAKAGAQAADSAAAGAGEANVDGEDEAAGDGGGVTPRLGDAWNSALTYYHEKERLPSLVPTSSWYPPSIFFQGMKFMLFGDPSLRLPRSRSTTPPASE